MSIFTPLSDDLYSLQRAQILIKLQGGDRWQNVGDCEDFTVGTDLTEIDRYGKDSDTKVLRRTDVIQKGGTVSLTLLQSTDFLRAANWMADVNSYLVQAAVAAGSVTFTDVNVGDIFDLGAADVAVTTITDGTAETPVAYIAGTHYRVDRRTGLVEIIAIPATADTDIAVTFTAPAITADTKRFSGGPMQNNGVRCSIRARGQGAIGDNLDIVINDVVLRPDGDIVVQGADDYDQVKLTGKMFAVGTEPVGFEYGRVTTIPKTALVA